VFTYFGGFTTGKSLDVNEFKAYAKSVDEISTPQEYNIIALGEVTHGNKEFQQLKLEVFKKLVEEHRVHSFALEGDFGGAVKFFDEAVNLETDNVKKAEKAYAAAAVLASAKKLSQARAYCQKAIGFNENYGAPYILIANLYAMSPNWSDEPALNKCTYFAVIDKLQRAKQVDPSVAEEANKLIGRYSGHTPQAKDLFMLGYKQGDRITIGGWIGETTTIR
jgi:tetratricopeptide (TPR) repeat protein